MISEIRAVQKDQRHLYDRVVGSVMRDPNSWDQNVAKIMRDLAQLNYLGSAGLATITEPAKIIMEHGLGPTMRGLFTVLKNNQLKLGAQEGRIAGEIHEISLITRALKDFDSMVRCHTLIDYSVRWVDGKATKMEQEYLLRYNINLDDAKKIAKSPWQKGESGLYLANTEAWAKVTGEETVQTFRNALGSGIMNTILMGTPADKPIITDGIVYIPMRVAGKFGMKEDSSYKGYARIENGLLGLPFQFYSYSLAAVNKTMGAYAHGQLKSQYIGTAIAMGLGYMALQAKTPDWVELSFQEADTLDAVTGVLGAGPSITTDLGRAVYEMTTGDIGEGSKDFIRNLPYARLWFLKGKVNELTNMLGEELDGPRGMGRF